MALTHRVHIARRFQRSIRIDSDLYDSQALEGFICPKSSSDVLLSMARHVHETGHGAFTWTGPYGSGKSSLVIALSALLSGDETLQKAATIALGQETANALLASLPPLSKGWQVIPVVGRRDHPARVIGEAIEESALLDPKGQITEWTDTRIVSVLVDAAHREPRNKGGLILFIDEMGKFLESAAGQGSDIYLFQQLAEAASRSHQRLLIIGVLHQAFEEYANRLSREMRDEWSKIQGRFIDLAVNTAGEEQIELLSRAIVCDHEPSEPGELTAAVAEEVRRQRPAASKYLGTTLEACWPLHPVVACLLGPISRRRFGQNQRSLFGFLNSAEPYGFQDFLRQATDGDLYQLHQLWDYLKANLEPAILASPDGHRWALAADAIERCEATGSNRLHLTLLKAVALLDLFKDRSGFVPTFDLLRICVPDEREDDVRNALDQLQGKSFILFRKFNDAYGIYAGSDFDIDHALESALERVKDIDFTALKRLAGIQPVLAKRHYHQTGALRWFDVDLIAAGELVRHAANYNPKNGTIGQFLLAIPTEGESEELMQKYCREAARQAKEWDIVAGFSRLSWAITGLARDLIALEQVRDESPELGGDAIARREVRARLASLQGQLEEELHRAFDNATWYLKHKHAKRWRHAELNSVASDLAGRRFEQTPKLHNELLNRVKPSSSAIAAQNALLNRMVTQEGVPRLGIEGFPAEGGLFASVLEATGLYAQTPNGWRFMRPASNGVDPSNLGPLWDAAEACLNENADRTVTVSALYDLWRQPPYGVKEGLMPILAVAFIQSRRETIALYRQGVFQARFTDLDVEYLANDASDVQLRWMNLSEISRRLLSAMAEIVRELDEQNSLSHLAPIDVARGLIAIYDGLHPYMHRTMRLSSNAVRVRSVFKQANDPNKFLFDDIPDILSTKADLASEADLQRIVVSVREGLEELVQSYSTMLSRLRDTMLAELQVPNASPQALVELRARAENIRQLAGDFRLDAFVGRLTRFEGTQADIEGIASLAANKPPRDWVDPDLDRAAVEIADMAQRFIRAEAFARVKGRTDKRHAMAVVVGINGRPGPVHEEFDIMDTDQAAVEDLIARVEHALEDAHPKRKNIILAALAELSARYMQPSARDQGKEKAFSR
ncbi:MAG: ATP-binding protein [Candidatus Tectimicrobiota bacterium]